MVACIATLGLRASAEQELPPPVCTEPLHAIHAISDGRTPQDFELFELTHPVTEVSKDALLVGGARDGRAVLAKLSLPDHTIDITAAFEAEATVAVARAPDSAAADVVAIAASIDNNKVSAFVVELDSTGTTIQEPISLPVLGLSGCKRVSDAVTSLSFDEDGNVIVALSCADSDSSTMVVVDTTKRAILRHQSIPSFTLTPGNDAVVRVDDKVYLAGSSASEAAIAAVSLADDQSEPLLLRTGATRVAFLFASASGDSLYGAALEEPANVATHFTVQLDAQGALIPETLETGSDVSDDAAQHLVAYHNADKEGPNFGTFDIWANTDDCMKHHALRKLAWGQKKSNFCAWGVLSSGSCGAAPAPVFNPDTDCPQIDDVSNWGYTLRTAAITKLMDDDAATSTYTTCPVTFTWTVELLSDGTDKTSTQPILSFNTETRVFTADYSGADTVLWGGDNDAGITYKVKLTMDGPTYTDAGGNSQTVKFDREFEFLVLNPCFDPALIGSGFTPLSLPASIDYTLGDAEITIDQITMPQVDSTYCTESIEYEILFNGNAVTASSTPVYSVAVSETQIQLKFFTIQPLDVGYNQITYQAKTIQTRRLRNLAGQATAPVDPFANTQYGTQTVINVLTLCPTPGLYNNIADQSVAFDQLPLDMASEHGANPVECGALTTTITNVSAPVGNTGDMAALVTAAWTNITTSISPTEAAGYVAGDYKIKITLQLDLYPTTTLDTEITITLINPCELAASTKFSWMTDPLTSSSFDGLTYYLGQPDETMNVALSLITDNRVYAGCGTIEYEITGDTTPFTFALVSTDYVLTLPQTSDTAKVGTYNIKVKAFHTGYNSYGLESNEITVTIADPCDGATINLPSAKDIDHYINESYTEDVTSQISVTPSQCTSWSVSVTDNVPGTFNPNPIQWSDPNLSITAQSDLSWMDSETTSKEYTVTISVTIANAASTTDSVDFTVNVLNPCVVAGKVTISSPVQVNTALTHNYDNSTITWTYTPFTASPSFCTMEVGCSTITGPSSGVLQPLDYKVDAWNQVTLTFTLTDYLEGFLTPGTYTFDYEAYPTGASAVSALISTFQFQLTMVDPCLAASTTNPTFVDYTYTITDVATSFPFSSWGGEFDVPALPGYCDPTLTLTTSSTDLDPHVTLVETPGSQSLDFAQIVNSIKLSRDTPGTIQNTHTVTVTYELFSPYVSSGSSAVQTVTQTLTFTAKNPCVDPAFVWVTVPDPEVLADTTYIVHKPLHTWDPYDMTASPPHFQLKTAPVKHDLCGTGVLMVPYYDGTTPLPTGLPTELIWSSDAHNSDDELTVYSEDCTLIGQTKTYSLRTEVKDWANQDGFSTGFTKRLYGSIQFQNPCDDPFTFVVPTQDNASSDLSDNYSGTDPIDFYLNPFTVTPDCCTLTYSCESISELGQASSSISCSDFESSITLDGSSRLQLNPTSTEYTQLSPWRPGTYTVTIKALVNEASSDVPGTTSKTTTFDFTLVDPCDPPTSIVVPPADAVADFGYTIGDPKVTVDVDQFTIDPSYCPYTLAIVPETLVGGETPITKSNSDGEAYVEDGTNQSLDTVVQTTTTTATSYSTFGNVNTLKTQQDSFKVTYTAGPACDALDATNASIDNPTQTASVTGNYLGTAFTWSYSPHTTTPLYCSPPQLTCDSVAYTSGGNTPTNPAAPFACPTINTSTNLVTLSFSSTEYNDGSVPPGTYTISYTASADYLAPGTASALNPTFSFQVILNDPCDGSASTGFSFSGGSYSDYSYTIGESQYDVSISPYTITPSFCVWEYSVTSDKSLSTYTDNQSSEQIEIEYTADLTPVGESEVFTVTAVSKSLYAAVGNPNGVTVTDTFTITYLNPCLDPTYVTLNTNTNSDPASNAYDGTTMTWTYTAATSSNSLCTVDILCTSASFPTAAGTAGLTSSDFDCPFSSQDAATPLTITQVFDAARYNGNWGPGDYTYNFKEMISGSSNAALFNTFSIDFTVTDPCTAATNAGSTTTTSTPYTIGDPAVTYNAGSATPSSSVCNVFGWTLISTSSRRRLSSHGRMLSHSSEELIDYMTISTSTGLVTIPQITTTLDFVGTNSVVYKYKIYTWNNLSTTTIYQESYSQVINNPCIDQTKTFIHEGSNPATPQTTTLYSAIITNYYIHDHATSYTESTGHNVDSTVTLCGGVSYSYTYDGSAITTSTTSTPLTVSESSGDRVFTASSSNDALWAASPVAVTVTVELDDWPTATYATASSLSYSATITYLDPRTGTVCQDSTITSFDSHTNGDTDVTDSYTGTDKKFTYSTMTVTPSICSSLVTTPACSTISSVFSCGDYALNGSDEVVFNFPPADYIAKTYAPGTYTFTYEVNTGGSGALSTTFSFDLDLEDPCVQTGLSPPFTIVDTQTGTAPSYYLGVAGATTYNYSPLYSINDSEGYCETTMTGTASSLSSTGVPFAFDDSTQTTTIGPYSTNLTPAGGLSDDYESYTLTYTFSYKSRFSSSNTDSDTYSTVAYIYNPCQDTTYWDIVQTNQPSSRSMSILPTKSYVPYDNEITWTVTEPHAASGANSDIQTLCASTTIAYYASYGSSTNIDNTLDASTGDNLAFEVDGSGNFVFRLYSNQFSDSDTSVTYKVLVEFTQYDGSTFTSAASYEYSGTINYGDLSALQTACETASTPTTLTSAAQTGTVTYPTFGSDTTWTYVPYTTTPGYCVYFVTVACSSVTGPDTFGANSNIVGCSNIGSVASDNDLTLNFPLSDYTGGVMNSGEYTITFEVKIGSTSASSLKDTFDVVMTVADPCSSVTITIPTIPDFTYTIYDPAEDYDFSAGYSVSEDFCNIVYSASATCTQTAASLLADPNLCQNYVALKTKQTSATNFQIKEINDSLRFATGGGFAEQDYTVTLKQNVLGLYPGGPVLTTQDSNTFVIKVKDPCPTPSDINNICPVSSFMPPTLSNYDPSDLVTSTFEIDWSFCDDPVSLTFMGQGDSLPEFQHSYDGAYVREWPTFIAEQADGCGIQYTCRLEHASSGSTIGCATEGLTTFNPSTAEFSFTARHEDYAVVPPGTYRFAITGVAGTDADKALTATYEFDIVLEDPCSTATLEFNEANLFPGTDLTYVIGGATATKTFNYADLVGVSHGIDCGAFFGTFYTNPITKEMDTSLFSVTNEQGEGAFTVKDQTDPDKAGTWGVYFTISLADYPQTSIDVWETYSREAFSVTIETDPCTPNFNGPAQAFDVSCAYEQLCNPVYDDQSSPSESTTYLTDPNLQWLRDLKYVEAASSVATTFDYNASGNTMSCFMSDLNPVQTCDKVDFPGAADNGITVDNNAIMVEAGLAQGQWPSKFKFFALTQDFKYIYVEKCIVVRVDLPTLQAANPNSDMLPSVSSDSPLLFSPYVSDVSADGIITIAFDEPVSMASSDLFFSSGFNRRLSAQEDATPALVDVRLTGEPNSGASSLPLDWHLKDFDGRVAHLQLDYEGVDASVYDYVQVTIVDKADQVTSESGKHIKHTPVNFKMAPLVKQESAERMRTIAAILLSIVCIALVLAFMVAIFCSGSLVNAWLCLNSLQVLAHVPLVAAALPADAHYFFLNVLSVVRLNFSNLNSSVDTLASDLAENGLIKSEDAVYSAQLHNFGYRYNFAHNMLLIGVAALVLGLAWIFMAIFNRLRTQNESSTKISMKNCMVRFALEAHFELMICSFITLSNTDAVGSTWWLVSLASVVASVCAVVALTVGAGKKTETAAKITAPTTIQSDAQNNEENRDEVDPDKVANTDVPLNQMLGAAIQLDEAQTTERGEITTQRGMVSGEDLQTEIALARSKALQKAAATSSFYTGVDVARYSARLEPVMFLTRRTVVAAILVLLQGSPLVASAALMCTTIAMLGYTAVVRPYKAAVTNNVAIVSELFLAIFIVLLYNARALPALVSIAFMMFATFITAVAVVGAACLDIVTVRASPETLKGAAAAEEKAVQNAIQMPEIAKVEASSPSKTKPLELKAKKFSEGSTDSDQGSCSTGPGTERDEVQSEDAQPVTV